MANTTRRVAGKIVYKSAKGVIKNVAKNLAHQALLATTISSGQWLFSKKLGTYTN